jgi:putative addiction module antidote
MTTVKLTTIGNSVGIILPKDLLTKLSLAKGDTLFVSDTPEGIHLSPYDPKMAKTMEAFERVSRRYRDALRELAK